MLLLQDDKTKSKDELIQEKSDLEFQMFRMQENIKEIAKKWDILGIDQTKEDNWVIIYSSDDKNTCKIMLNDCSAPFRGKWDFSIHAQYTDDNTIQIDDIRGEENRGYGTVCMNHLKEYAQKNNVQYIKGNLVKRDWDHIDRLVHFYKKHYFHVNVSKKEKQGTIIWQPAI
ncbi:hypothetical protein JSY36_01890 [Bacillus sp. H-16]|uniref:hypothetical protein n=1 Tax=Alteribacter salitolerans TaxID=2912333 RepID=UPI001966C2AE|nr:hypothetical protein [Alteribacter salitolerans]MBM7094493.1 hypothetical protein [Alteribacter salitolerans]